MQWIIECWLALLIGIYARKCLINGLISLHIEKIFINLLHLRVLIVFTLLYWESDMFGSYFLASVFLLWVSMFYFIIWNSLCAGNFLLLFKILVKLPIFVESLISYFFLGDSECCLNKWNLPFTLSNLGSDFYVLIKSCGLVVVLTDVFRLVEVLRDPNRLL